MLRRAFAVPFLVALGPVAAHCGSSDPPDPSFSVDASAEASPTSSPTFNPVGCDGPCADTDAAAAVVCGDGRIGYGEGCDDSNTTPGDGCSASCQVEPGYVCPPSSICRAAKCGDGVIAGDEECEYNGTPVEGCSAACRILPDYDCDPKTLTCKKTSCGNKITERGETCDDGPNDLPFDGCYACKKEPSCSGGVCIPQCGDGQRFEGEECDDGNARNGDGCSSDCKVEKGFTCADQTGAPPDSIALPILARDFIGFNRTAGASTHHPDFNALGGDGVRGILEPTLDVMNKPVFACPGGDCAQNPGAKYLGGDGRPGDVPNMSTPANFNQWYRNTDGVNLQTVVMAPLAKQGDGTYLWNSATASQNGGKTWFDPFGPTGGWIAQGKETAASCGGGANARNVSWTSETHFFFEYQGGESFAFAGDDDTWVFVDKKLVIDLGGLHIPATGSFTLDAIPDGGTAAGNASYKAKYAAEATEQTGTVALGLKPGGVYEVVMFQAERNECGSNFKVTLKNFNRPKSKCESKCGDGIVAKNEACDDGKNDGSYGGCKPGCQERGGFCGDGKVDPGEQCDDGNTNPVDTCANDCRPPLQPK